MIRNWSTVRVSHMGLIIWAIAFSMALAFLLIRWYGQSRQLSDLDARISSLEEEVAVLQERELWSKQLVRIHSTLSFLTRNRLAKKQSWYLTEQLWEVSRTFQFDPLLVLALVGVESQGNPNALGRKRSGEFSGAMGLMQVKLETAKAVAAEFGIPLESEADLLKPEINLLVGSMYLVRLTMRYGNVRHGIMAYNVGPSGLEQRLRNRESLPLRYYNRILSNYAALVRKFGEEPFL